MLTRGCGEESFDLIFLLGNLRGMGSGHWRDPPSLQSSPFLEQGLQSVSEAAEANLPSLPCLCVLVCVQVFVTTLCDPMDCSPPGFCPWNSPGKDTGVDCCYLLQRRFPWWLSW